MRPSTKKSRHPAGTLISSSIQTPSVEGHVAVSDEEVRKAILLFPAGSAGGPDGRRPQHLKEFLLCREAGFDFSAAPDPVC